MALECVQFYSRPHVPDNDRSIRTTRDKKLPIPSENEIKHSLNEVGVSLVRLEDFAGLRVPAPDKLIP